MYSIIILQPLNNLHVYYCLHVACMQVVISYQYTTSEYLAAILLSRKGKREVFETKIIIVACTYNFPY